MNDKDKQILEVIQTDFPLSENPYEELAKKLQMTGEELFKEVKRLIEAGVIRRIGLSVDSGKFGYNSTLAAVSVGPEDVDKAAAVIGQYVEVTHSYLRQDEFNIWFTLIAESKRRIEDILEQIRVDLGLGQAKVLNLPVKRLFKLDARFKPSD